MPTRSFAASVFVAALALTGCAAEADKSQPAGSELADKTDVVRIDAISPASGSLLGGETVTLSGQGLSEVSSVLVGGVATTPVVAATDHTVQIVMPPALDYQAGMVSVSASTDDEVITGEPGYDYRVVTPVDAQMQYAFAHWQDYNDEVWGVFPDNDCGNFVNQTLIARGWQPTDEWYSEWNTTGDFSDSWARGPAMDEWFASQTDRATRLSLEQRDQVKVGDVVMFDWDPQNENGVDHTMLVSKVDAATGAISMVGHTIDAQYRDLDQVITIENPGATAWFYSIA